MAFQLAEQVAMNDNASEAEMAAAVEGQRSRATAAKRVPGLYCEMPQASVVLAFKLM